MQLDPSRFDPSRWLISFAGFTFDWMLTREWKRVIVGFVPAFVLLGLGLAVASGSRLDRNRLAQWYLDLGNEQIADWEQKWAPSADVASTTASMEGGPTAEGDAADSNIAGASSTAATGSDSESADLLDGENKVPRFAESLFARVQSLVPSERSQFVIAATLAQRGAIEKAKALLVKIAPASGRGYAPAHALMAQFLIVQVQQQQIELSREVVQLIMHHASQAKLWERVPRSVLLVASDLYAKSGNIPESTAMLAISAERHPEDNYALAQRAAVTNDERLFQKVWPKAEAQLVAALEANPLDVDTRLKLAQTYAMAKDLDRAEKTLLEAPASDRDADVKRGMSQLYLVRYSQSLSTANNQVTVNLKLLDAALHIDPTNPRISEEVAKLVRLQGPKPSDELVAHMQQRLADGTATAVTHACIAETRLVRGELEKAIPHLEQVVQRLPDAAEYLNNLAYCLAELHPERLEEALGYSERAIAAAGRERNADYFDTLCYVLSKLNRHSEALAAIETAIDLKPKRPDFHLRAAVEYRALNNELMAELQENTAEQLKIAEAQRIEAERIEAERLAAEQKLEAERLEAERLKAEQTEALRYASEQAMIAIAIQAAAEERARAEAEEAAEADKVEDAATAPTDSEPPTAPSAELPSDPNQVDGEKTSQGSPTDAEAPTETDNDPTAGDNKSSDELQLNPSNS